MTTMAAELGSQPDRESQLTHALAAVRSRLAAAAEAVGRNVGEIELLPITKFFPATDVAILSRLGCRAVGESREQEAAAKAAELTRLLELSGRADSRDMKWHMVGKIQRKKAKSLARWAHTVHSADSPCVNSDSRSPCFPGGPTSAAISVIPSTPMTPAARWAHRGDG